MDLFLIGQTARRLCCFMFGHDYVIKVPAQSLVNIWCGRCGSPFPTKI